MKWIKFISIFNIVVILMFNTSPFLLAQEEDEYYDEEPVKEEKKEEKKKEEKKDEEMDKIDEFYDGDIDEEKLKEKQKKKAEQIKELKNKIEDLAAQKDNLKQDLENKKISEKEYKKQTKNLDKKMEESKDNLFIIGGKEEVTKLENELKGKPEEEEKETDVIIFDDDTMIDLIGEGTEEEQADFFDRIQKAKEKKVERISIANIHGFEEKIEHMWELGIWIGSAPDTQLRYEITDEEAYAGKQSLLVQYNIGENVYQSWMAISISPKKVLDLSKSRSLTMAIKSRGMGGTVVVSLSSSGGGSWKYEDYYAMFNPDWTELKVPLDYTPGLDKSKVVSITISFGFSSRFGGERISGMVGNEYLEMGTTAYNPSVGIVPTSGYCYIDEISYTSESAKLSSGPAELKVFGNLVAQYRNIESVDPYMANTAYIDMDYVTDKYTLSGAFSIPLHTIYQWNSGVWDARVYLDTIAFAKYGSKRWMGWSHEREMYVSGINANIKDLNPYIKTIAFGGLAMPWGLLAINMVYNQAGIGVDGKLADTDYNFCYIKLAGAGYGVGSRFKRKIDLLDTFVNTAVLWEDRKGQVTTTTYKSYKHSYIGFIELERKTKHDFPASRRMLGLGMEAGIYTADEQWYGHSDVAPNYGREIQYNDIFIWDGVKYEQKDYEGIAWRAMLEGHILFPSKLKIGERVEYRYIDPYYMGIGVEGPLEGLAIQYTPILRGIDYKMRYLYCEGGYDWGRELSEKYWQDLKGFLTDTTLGWKWFEMRYYYDISNKVSNEQFDKTVNRIFTRFSIWKLVLGYVYRKITWENELFKGDNALFTSNEGFLKFLLLDHTHLTFGYGDQKHWADITDEIIMHDNVYYASLQKQVFDNVAFSLIYKKVDNIKEQEEAGAGVNAEDIEEVTEYTGQLESISYFIAAVKFMFGRPSRW